MKKYLVDVGSLGDDSNLRASVATESNPNAILPGDDWPIFCVQYCVAAQELAEDLAIRLQDLGVLHTGLTISGVDTSNSHARSGADSPKLKDVESIRSEHPLGKGQVIFVLRNVDLHEAENLVACGFRFARLANISGKSTRVLEIMATKMQVRKGDLLSTLETMRPITSTTIPAELNPCLKPNSHYISLFALRPRFQPSNCRWDVMVYKEDLSMIPCFPYDINKDLEPSVQSMLQTFEGKTPNDMCSFFNDANQKHDPETDGYLADWVTGAIRAFREHIPQQIFQNALFSPTPVRVPATGSVYGGQAYATIWSFTVILDVHNSSSGNQNLQYWSWVPFNFFRCLQLTGQDSPHHAILARKNHVEFSTIFGEASRHSTIKSCRKDTVLDRAYNTLTKIHCGTKTTSSRSRTPAIFTHSENSSQNKLVRAPTRDCDSQISAIPYPLPYGGIMISQDVVVQSNGKFGAGIELQDIGLKSTAGVATDEKPIWVDDLYTVLVGRWLNRGYRENRREKWVF
jgi:hypothetical protein